MDHNMVMDLKKYLLEGEYPKDADKHQRYILKRKALNFCMIDDDLFYIRHKGSHKETKCKVVCSAAEADALFKEFHYSDIGAHVGQLKTRSAISQRYYWPGMSTDIEKWYAEKILTEEPLTFSNETSAVNHYRREVAMTLLNKTDDLSELCHHCGEKNTLEKQGRTVGKAQGTTWIQCDTCDRWYHVQCVGRPDPMKSYSCAACQF